MWQRWKALAIKLRKDLLAIYLAYGDPRTPRYAKLCAMFVVAYACSPIDLIPDFVPILGYLDDLILVPLGIAAVVRMIPQDVMQQAREQAERGVDLPRSRGAAVAIFMLWLVVGIWLIRLALGLWRDRPGS